MKAVFLDRDGVITKDPGFNRYDRLELLPGAAEAIKRLNEKYIVIVVTNQPVVARGIMTEDEIRSRHERLAAELAKHGAKIDAFYFCPHHPEKHHADIPEHAMKYRIECACRKPGTGMIDQACKDFDIDLPGSFVVGDRASDIEMGKAAGCRTIFIGGGEADYVASGILDASKIINPDVTAVILAGGRGERLRPLTDTMPKPMIKIAGKPVLQHQIEILRDADITDIVVCGSYLIDNIKEYFGSEWEGVHIEYPDEPDRLGSGGAIRNAYKYLKDADRFIIINGDKMIGKFDFRRMIEFDLQKKCFATVLVRETDHPLDSDIIRLEGDRVIQFIGRGQDLYRTSNSGIIIAGQSLIKLIPEGVSNIEKDILFRLVGEKDIYGFMLPSGWFVKDMGTPERLASVRAIFEVS
ncbi:MAG TPA: HAD-IIIA family hydrolase [archaeon]|nr:HAD-IIIA family hydrolase [archaeon]